MPLGSSSEAPVMSPGPITCVSFGCFGSLTTPVCRALLFATLLMAALLRPHKLSHRQTEEASGPEIGRTNGPKPSAADAHRRKRRANQWNLIDSLMPTISRRDYDGQRSH